MPDVRRFLGIVVYMHFNEHSTTNLKASIFIDALGAIFIDALGVVEERLPLVWWKKDYLWCGGRKITSGVVEERLPLV